MTPEGKVKKKVKDLLKANGYWHYMPVQNGMGVVGIPDIIACVPLRITSDMVGKSIGVFTAIETKAPGRRKATTANQRAVLLGISESDGVAVVADDVETVSTAISRLRSAGVPTYEVPT